MGYHLILKLHPGDIWKLSIHGPCHGADSSAVFGARGASRGDRGMAKKPLFAFFAFLFLGINRILGDGFKYFPK